MTVRSAGRVGGAVGLLAVITAVVMLVGVIGLFVLGTQGRTPQHVTSPGDPVVKRARFTRVFDLDGALRVSPPTGSPRVPESRAIATFRAVSDRGSLSFLRDVVIGFGLVTLRADLTPNGQPVLARQPSWVVTYEAVGTSLTCSRPEGRPVFILDARTGSHGIDYVSGTAGVDNGRGCSFPPRGPQARTAAVVWSVPWILAGTASDGRSVTVRYLLPPCGTPAGVLDGPTAVPVEPIVITAAVPLNDVKCSPPVPQTLQLPVRLGQPVLHGTVGLCKSSGSDPCTAAVRFEYFDGRVRSST